MCVCVCVCVYVCVRVHVHAYHKGKGRLQPAATGDCLHSVRALTQDDCTLLCHRLCSVQHRPRTHLRSKMRH